MTRARALALAVVIAFAGCSEGLRTARDGPLKLRAELPWDAETPHEDPGPADVTIEVHTQADVRPISPLIYGTNGALDLARNRPTVVRAGGDRYTAYNWENNASNAGVNHQFQNDGYLAESNEPAKPVLDLVELAEQHGASTIVTVPIVDYVAADKRGHGDVRNSGPSYLRTRFKKNRATKGGPPAAKPDPHDAFVNQDEFIAYLKKRAPKARILFALDNEPGMWPITHAEVHPRPVTYTELWERNHRFAQMIDRVWPGAEVLGLVSHGWNGLVSLHDAPDARGRDLVEWYLTQAQAAAKGGERAIDYLDLHWYPEAKGAGTRVTTTSTAPEVVAARVQAPRSLWDPSYEEQSWIHDQLGGPIDLIHRLKAKIDAHYPGTKLSFSEWNFGAGHHISGAVATADVLGIFGREGVALAAFWPLSADESFSLAALRAYRNYDGRGSAFGDLAVRASSSAPHVVTAYASTHSAEPNHIVVIAINKAKLPLAVGLSLQHPVAFEAARVYELSGTAPELVAKPEQDAHGTNNWRLNLPAYSVSVIVPREE